MTALFRMNTAVDSRIVGRRRWAISTIASTMPVALDTSAGQIDMPGTWRAIRKSIGRPIALRPQAISAPRQLYWLCWALGDRGAGAGDMPARGSCRRVLIETCVVLQHRRQRVQRDGLADHLRVAQPLRLDNQRVGSRVAGQEDDPTSEPVLAQPAVGVEPARNLGTEIDVEDRDAAPERALAEIQQVAVAADAVTLALVDRSDEVGKGGSQILVVIEEQHVAGVAHRS